MCCVTRLCAEARPHTFSLILLFPLSHHVHTHTRPRGATPWYWAHCISEIQSLVPLCADVSKNPILLFYCVSGNGGPSLRAQGHRTHQHKEPYLLLSVHVWKCVLSLSIYLPASLAHAHIYTYSISAAVTLSYSFTLHALCRQLLECPDLKYTEITTIASLTMKYQPTQSGLCDSELLLVERWSHC